jgi:hypothetical protein
MPVDCEARLHGKLLMPNKPYMESCLLGVHDLELSWTSTVRGDRHRYFGNW